MLTFTPQRICLVLLAAAFSVAATVFSFNSAEAAFNVSDGSSGVVDLVGIDVDTTGNTPLSVASLETSGSAVTGSSFSVDVVVDEIHASDGISGFQSNLLYNGAVLQVTGISTSEMVAQQPGSTIFSTSDSVPDSDGSYAIGFTDTSPNTESGEGVIVRLTLECLDPGTSTLDLQDQASSSTKPTVYSGAYAPLLLNQHPDSTVTCEPEPVGGAVDLVVTPASGDASHAVWYIAGSLALGSVIAAGAAGRRFTRRRVD